MNNGMIDRLAGQFAARVWQEAGADRGAQVEHVSWIALGRAPTRDERKVGVSALRELAGEWAKQKGEGAVRKALTSYCRAVVNSAGFLYVD
jgi:hypothetical protein